jgi:hypothetical protein
MKQLLITLAVGLLAVTARHARPGWTLDKCLPDTEGVGSDGTSEFSDIAGERPERSASDGITGGGITKEAIRSVVSDPDSVKLESSTSPWIGHGRGGACWVFKVAFRYRNGFGGYVRSVAMVYWRNEKVIDCVIDF